MVKSYLLLLSCVFIWAANYIVRQVLLREFSPLFLSAFSLTLVAAVFLVWALVTRSLVRLARNEMVWFSLSALIGLVANQLFLFNGLKYTSATNASLIFSLSPLITAVLAAVFLKEIITWRMVVGSMVAITGLFLVLELQGQFRLAFGDLMILGAAFTFSCNLIFIRILSRRLSPLIITVYSFAISALIFDPFALSVTDINWNHPLSVWRLAILSVIFAQGLTGIMWNKGMEIVGAAKSAIVLNLQPLMTLLLDFWIFQQTLTVQQIFGATLVFLGILLGTLQNKRLDVSNHSTHREG